MDVLITIKNYRCFQDANPVSFVLHSAVTRFVSVNNAGKSSLLKFFYELRPLFKLLSAPSEEFQNALHSSIPHYSVGYGMSVKDRDEIFCKLNDRNLELAIEFREHQPRNNTTELWNPTKAILNISRSDHSWWLILFTENEGAQFDSRNARAGQFRFVGTELAHKQWPNLELLAFFELFMCFAEMLYIGPFRNAINVVST